MSHELDCARTRDRHRERGEDRGIPGTPLILLSGIRPMLDGLWLVDKLLGENSFSVLYGQPGSGKSMLALDLAMSIAVGCEWFGRKVRPGAVIYATGEGVVGVRHRLIAFKREYRKAGKIPEDDVALALYPETVNLFESADDARGLIEASQALKYETREPVVLIVIDTLADALAGGDENSGKDMGLLLKRVRRIQTETGAHVMLVHHTGKDSGSGARGHSSLKAKCDTMIKVESNKASIDKQKDAPQSEPLAFQIKAVFLGNNKSGEPEFATVIEPQAPTTDPDAKIARLTPQPRQAYALLCNLIEKDGVRPPEDLGAQDGARVVTDAEWRQACETGNVFIGRNGKPSEKSMKSRFYKIKKTLIDQGLIVSPKDSGIVWLAPGSGNSDAPAD